MTATWLSNRRVLIVGLGRSGLAAAKLCLAHGARVTVTDNRPTALLTAAVEQLCDRAVLELGGHRPASFTNAELIVLSPGVPPLPELQAASATGVPIIGEIELAARFITAPIVAITGTNGKSTTTTLVGDMLAASGIETFCGGNLGPPLAEAVLDGSGHGMAGPDGRVVLELSSFQLETVASFHAHVAVLLNVSEDHLDRYVSYEEYQQAKARVFERQTAADYAVVNGEADQRPCAELARRSAARLLRFTGQMRTEDGPRPSSGGAWLAGDRLVVHLPQRPVESYPRALLRIAGQHNALNALAALLAARLAGATPRGCAAGLANFRGLPHRMELVVELDDVQYYNDSKATNVGSVVGSLAGFPRPVVLIAGGKDKGGDYRPLLPIISSVCRHVVLLGAAADRIAAALDGAVPLHRADSIDQAVQVARGLAQTGDAVVLSPACSSYDMFRDFEHRGEAFTRAVRSLPV